MHFPFVLEEGRRPKNAFRVQIVMKTCICINGMSFEFKYVSWLDKKFNLKIAFTKHYYKIQEKSRPWGKKHI